MKISCNIIEDLLPLYVDDMVSEDSRQLVEEHLKECPSCRKMQEEMMRENRLTAGIKDSNSVQINKTEAEAASYTSQSEYIPVEIIKDVINCVANRRTVQTTFRSILNRVSD